MTLSGVNNAPYGVGHFVGGSIKKNTARARCMRRIDVALLVADDNAIFRIDTKQAGGVQNHTW